MKTLRQVNAALAALALVLLAMFIAAGCHTQAAPQHQEPQGVNNAQSSNAGVQAHNESAEGLNQQMNTMLPPEGKPISVAQSSEHAAVKREATKTDAALAQAKADYAALHDKYDEDLAVANDGKAEVTAAFAEYKGLWRHRAADWIWNALIWVATAWIAVGLFAVIGGICNPATFAFQASRWLIHALPLMNPFSWMKDFANNVASAKVATAVAATCAPTSQPLVTGQTIGDVK
jgi:hypothetical protein